MDNPYLAMPLFAGIHRFFVHILIVQHKIKASAVPTCEKQTPFSKIQIKAS